MEPQIIRTVCFSHYEYALHEKATGDPYQLICRLDENQSGVFLVSVFLVDLERAYTKEKVRQFKDLKGGLDWIMKVYDMFDPIDAPEVLYLPEWNPEPIVTSYILKWSDNLFKNTEIA